MNIQSSVESVCDQLGYNSSPTFVYLGEKVGRADDNFAHLYKRAEKHCGLKGVYTCKDGNSANTIPVVYVCQAKSEEEAHKIHQKVWNQNIVPFLLIVSPGYVRLYNGFGFDLNHPEPIENIPWAEVQKKLKSLSGKSIDEGAVWYSNLWKNGPADQSHRLDVRLLEHLNSLGDNLVKSENLKHEVAHGLIGKFVYLRYLRDRQFLSDDRLIEWGITPENIFTRNINLESFDTLNKILQEELNGSIFPLPKENKGEKREFEKEHLRYVAGTFFGDAPQTGQGALFNWYDFAFIPTELLSTIYEQFLHRNDNQGKEKGAYYTPIPLVNFALNELEEKKPFTEGMRVLDPSCGSGAFLVQIYRHLIRKKLITSGKERLKPRELKKLLTDHIFGIDIDRDACRVAQLGLLLTLLDGLEPPSLFGSDKFHLPNLDDNIVEADTFDENIEILQQFQEKKFDWIIGNPPWKQLGKKSVAAQWIEVNKEKYPVSDSIAEAFAWRSLDFAKNDAVIGLLMPTMSLFSMKNKKGKFRQRFFTKCDVWTIANFANLRKFLFANADAACAAFFFQPERTESSESSILTYSPLRVNQTINRTGGQSKQGTWNVTINTSEIQYVRIQDAITGDPLVWKTAMWGSHRDLNLLRKIASRFESFEKFAKSEGIEAHSGLELRKKSETSEPVEYVPELKGCHRILIKKFRNSGRVFVFPPDVLEAIPEDLCYVRTGRKEVPLSVCQPPHILLDKARRFAIYSDNYFVVPSGQLGIAGKSQTILKVLALYCYSDFFRYHQFFLSPEWGVRADISTLDTFKCLPVPFEKMDLNEQKTWVNIYDQLQQNANSKSFSEQKQKNLLRDANERINKVLGLRVSEQILIHDFLEYKMKFMDGKVDKNLITPCDTGYLTNYTRQLEGELNAFFEDEDNIHHKVTVLDTESQNDSESMIGVRIDIIDGEKEAKLPLGDVRIPEHIYKLLLKKHSQWLYFQRELRIYDRRSIFVFKPNEKIHWIKSQALVDADNILGEILGMKGESR